MHAALIEAFDRPPRYTAFDDPVAGPGEVIVSVIAAALTQLARIQAAGKHYTSGKPPFVPGVDGVGRLDDGRRVYFAFPRAPFGAMAERVVVKSAYTLPVPDDVDATVTAAIANPGMSSWVALTERAFLQPAESVLVIGAGGASGRLAIQIAKHLGARRVVAAARNDASEDELRQRGADAFVPLTGSPSELADRFRRTIADGVDVVLDYVWGSTAEAFFTAATGLGTGAAAPRIRFVNIGSLGGPTATMPAAALRSSGIDVMGSGLGSVSHAGVLSATASMFGARGPAGLEIKTLAVPLTEVETAWQRETDARIVFTL
jgi:NADPH:quinone reductase-like Zn-dependent oxidoreductase